MMPRGERRRGDSIDVDLSPDDHRRLADLLHELDDADHDRIAPPPGLWARIEAQLDVPVERAAPRVAAADRLGAAGTREPATGASVTSLEGHRQRRRRVWVGVAAAAAAVVLVGATALLAGRSGSPGGDRQLVAATTLAPLVRTEARADAELVREDGRRRLVLVAHDMAPAPAGEHYELWLLDPSSPDAEPVALGEMAGSTTLDVPDDVDTSAYDVVDISLQAAGQDEHSGHSLLRGTLS